MAKGTINAGICGFQTTVVATKKDNGMIEVNINSDCDNIQKMAAELVEIDPLDEIFKRIKSTLTCEIASKHSPHPSCAVPSGILKTIEVEANLALPQEVSIIIER